VQVETGTLESIKKMAARDMGVGIVPRMCVHEEEESGHLVVRTVEEFREERMLWIVCRRGALSPACRAFIKVTKAEVKAVPKGEGRSTAAPPESVQVAKRRRRSADKSHLSIHKYN
jgi:DNA-binding transcriptional LysR family regulator